MFIHTKVINAYVYFTQYKKKWPRPEWGELTFTKKYYMYRAHSKLYI